MKALLLVLLLSGCATQRYLSEEEDQQMREACDKTGCVTMPVPVFQELLKRRGIAI